MIKVGMLARNPKTGKDLRIINLDTSVWRDQKTLVWLDKVPPKSMGRWDMGVTDTKLAEAMIENPADIVVCLNEPEEVRSWMEAGKWSTARLVVVKKSFINQHFDMLPKWKITNLLCLDEMDELYPFVGAKWDGTDDDAKILVALALHFGRTFPVLPTRKTEGLTVLQAMQTPQELWFITQYYQPDKRRRAEIDACLKKNTECEMIDKILLLNEKPMGQVHPKIQEKVIGKRLTYADVIRWIYEEAPPDIYVAFANADIFLDDTWRLLWSTDLSTKPKFLALLRWNVDGTTQADMDAAKLFGPRPDSQDTWVISSKAVKALKWDWETLNFPFGQGGCDNAITLEMFKQRFLIANPALTLKTYHYHTSEMRTYDPRDIVDRPSYLYIQPTGLHDMRPVLDWGKPARQLEREGYMRLVQGPLTNAQAKTFCSMVKRSTEDKLALEVGNTNMCTPPPIPIYEMNNIFQTREGLVYTYDSILVGKTRACTEAWSESQLSSMAVSLSVDEAIVAPLPNNVAEDAGAYVLHYLSKVFLLREFAPKAEFWCPKDRLCIEAMKMFKWPNKEIPVLSREDQQIWCKKAIVWPYEDKLPYMVSKEEVGALRKNLSGWQPIVNSKKLVLILDTWVGEECEEMFEGMDVKVIWPTTSLEVALNALRGAWGVITMNNQWLWALPVGAIVWEIQSEMQPSTAMLHLCAASSLKHRLVIVPKGAPAGRDKEAVMKKIRADAMEMTFEPPAVKQQVILPMKRQDFFQHAGDSFREMVAIWAERGYVDVVERPVEQVWLGGVGETLLYDRPTLEWLQASSEKSYKRGLFGNPVHGSPWTFWPRRPRLVEEMVTKSYKSYEAREKTLVFYGRSENAVQRKNRTGVDWESVCDDFSHRISNVAYTYTQEEYLERLANAKYGLCLAGYGNKCHREIECMAMGCVPIVAPEVDMTYADPPVEGLHYFRVSGPEEAKAVTQITPERWIVMSAACRDWWKRNASAEGSWELTARLAKNVDAF